MSSPSEASAVKRRFGKWSDPKVPHKGWSCTGTEDLGSDATQTCEMCETSHIRYAHTMEHPDYIGSLVVGCICAGNMEQDLRRAKDRESRVRNRAGKRTKWVSRNWKTSAKGHRYLVADGYRTTVRQNPRGWMAVVASIDDEDDVTFGNKHFPTTEAAQLAAFDFISSRLLKPPGRR